MTISDVNALKGAVKDAVLSWGGKKIDELFKNRAAVAVMAKRGFAMWLPGTTRRLMRMLTERFCFLRTREAALIVTVWWI